MSQHAKTVVAAVAAVLLAGVQAWQTAVDGHPFRVIYVLPIAVALCAAVLVHLIPNTGDQPVAKAIVAGMLAALNGATSLLAGDPAGVTALNLVIAALGALVTWYVPEIDSPVAAAAMDAATLAAKASAGTATVGDLQRTLEDGLAHLTELDTAAAADAPTAEIPAQPAPASSTPLPIEAAALAAATAG